MSRDIPAEAALKKYLESAAESDVPMQHRAETPECLSLHLLKKHLEQKVRLTDEQLEHIASCPLGFCQNNLRYLRKYGAQPISPLTKWTREKIGELAAYAQQRLREVSGLDMFLDPQRFGILQEPALTASTRLPQGQPQHSYPVLIEDAGGQTRNCVVTQGPWIRSGRLIMRISFEVPAELRERRPIQLLFVGEGRNIFNVLELPHFEQQLVNIQLPVALPDRTLEPEDPLPFALVLRLGEP